MSAKSSRSRRKFTKEFKAEAVAMVAASDGNVAKVARELNIYDSTLGTLQSMGATGVCWHNAPAESFFGTLKRELAHKSTWPTRADARRDLIRWIEGWFNPRRLHSTHGYHSPIETETDWHRHQAEADTEAA